MYHIQTVGQVDNGGMKSNKFAIASSDKINGFLAGSGIAPIAVASVPSDIKSALSAKTDYVLLSRYTADKQAKHPEITADSFTFLQEILDRGERLYDKHHHATIIHYRELPYVAILKVTADGGEVYLQSFRRSDAKNIASLKRRAGGE